MGFRLLSILISGKWHLGEWIWDFARLPYLLVLDCGNEKIGIWAASDDDVF